MVELIQERRHKNYLNYATHPTKCNQAFEERIQEMLVSPLDVNNGLWEAQISSGALGSSGALDMTYFRDENAELNRESLVLFRVHHALCDGVSLSYALGDMADESDQLKEKIEEDIRNKLCSIKKSKRPFLFQMYSSILFCCVFLLASLIALLLHLWRIVTASSPFDKVISASNSPAGRSVSWKHLDSLQNVKSVSKSISSSTTVNDLIVHLVAYAIQCQLDEHYEFLGEKNNNQKVNVVIPVHLNGGILLDGEKLGNKIGAFVATIPSPCTFKTSASSARAISSVLKRAKLTPAPLISWRIAKMCSDFAPDWLSKYLVKKFNAKAVAVISNVKGWPFHVHWSGRKVHSLVAFLPLPPAVPIGVVVQSYNSEICFSINADSRAVPEANKFANWMEKEYEKMKKEKDV